MGLSDVLVSPRYKGTNTPLKIYSYLKSGIPIMATDILTHTQVLDSSVAVLAKPSPEDFGKMTLELIRDKSLQVRLGKNAKRLAETKYSYEQFLEKTKNLCDYIEKTSIRG
jgi:glycosyltransferase involved in cell wall biosynthesis